MVAESAKGQKQQHIVGRPLCLFSIVSDPEKERGYKGDMDEVHPDERGAREPADHRLVGMVEEYNESKDEQGSVDPGGSISAHKADPEQKRCYHKNMK
jgi:hypothetical protein